SVNSRPTTFSAARIISLVTRIGCAGDGLGEGNGVGAGVCAKAFSGILVTARPATPAAGSNLTKLRRSIDLRFGFFMVGALQVRTPLACSLVPQTSVCDGFDSDAKASVI